MEMPRAERGNERPCRSCAASRSPPTSDQRERPSEKWRATSPAVAPERCPQSRTGEAGQRTPGPSRALSHVPRGTRDDLAFGLKPILQIGPALARLRQLIRP